MLLAPRDAEGVQFRAQAVDFAAHRDQLVAQGLQDRVVLRAFEDAAERGLGAREGSLERREGLRQFGFDGHGDHCFAARAPRVSQEASRRDARHAWADWRKPCWRMETVRYSRGMHRLLLVIALLTGTAAFAQSVQEHVHERGHEVMPFALGKTLHVFRMTDDGGVQGVLTRGDGPPDREQVRLIQQHLQMEAEAFRRGDFGDPAHLHGGTMPGLRELHSGASRIAITYRPLPNGAEIRFRTRDLHLVTAVHRWFGAQLSEHGADARAE